MIESVGRAGAWLPRTACAVAILSAALCGGGLAAPAQGETDGASPVLPWTATARLEHDNRREQLIFLIESSFNGDATIYETMVDGSAIPGADRDVPILRLVFQDRVFFDTDRVELKPEARRVIALVADELRRDVPDVAVFVAGHADSRGTDEYNYELSLRRAHSVAVELYRDGIGTTQLWQVGFGEAVPLRPNTSAENMAHNRRVEFLFAAKPEVAAVWLSHQSETVCAGYPAETQAVCRDKVDLLPRVVGRARPRPPRAPPPPRGARPG
jgi:outer membrane protein OmpA-like peptidoglycan-associated protein